MNEFLQSWLAKATNDLKISQHELALDDEEVVTDAVCFHCQQAVEKFLKAYLIHKNVEFGRTHNLEFLQQLCARHDASFLDYDFSQMSEYAVNVRYPDDFFTPQIEDAKSAYELAKNVEQTVLEKLQDDTD